MTQPSSIAFNGKLHPSRYLLLLLAGMLCLSNISIYLTLQQTKIAPTWTMFFTTISSLLSLIALLRYWRHQLVYRLEIDQQGKIILRCLGKQKEMQRGQFNQFNQLNQLDYAASQPEALWSENAELSSQSVIWMHLLIVHLVLANDRKVSIVVLRDSLDANSFRRLNITLRWLLATRHRVLSAGKAENSGNFH